MMLSFVRSRLASLTNVRAVLMIIIINIIIIIIMGT